MVALLSRQSFYAFCLKNFIRIRSEILSFSIFLHAIKIVGHLRTIARHSRIIDTFEVTRGNQTRIITVFLLFSQKIYIKSFWMQSLTMISLGEREKNLYLACGSVVASLIEFGACQWAKCAFNVIHEPIKMRKCAPIELYNQIDCLFFRFSC